VINLTLHFHTCRVGLFLKATLCPKMDYAKIDCPKMDTVSMLVCFDGQVMLPFLRHFTTNVAFKHHYVFFTY